MQSVSRIMKFECLLPCCGSFFRNGVVLGVHRSLHKHSWQRLWKVLGSREQYRIEYAPPFLVLISGFHPQCLDWRQWAFVITVTLNTAIIICTVSTGPSILTPVSITYILGHALRHARLTGSIKFKGKSNIGSLNI